MQKDIERLEEMLRAQRTMNEATHRAFHDRTIGQGRTGVDSIHAPNATPSDMLNKIADQRDAAEKELADVAKSLECEPQNVVLVALAARCSVKIGTHDFSALRELSETCCNHCDCFEDDGSLLAHCDACCRRIVTELYRRMHTGPQPDPAVTPDVYLVARCRNCGAVGAAHAIDVDPGMAIDLGQIAQQSVRGFLVRIEPGPVAITGCACELETKPKSTEQK
jgi:hypothetical protein